jgi:ubiquinone/menaquinone biosynthesis C-methylase UbiE
MDGSDDRVMAVEDQVAALADRYSQRAEAYDSLWSPAIIPFAVRLLDHLPLRTARSVLDVGTGAGALLPAIQHKASRALVTGIDRSEGMLRLARARHHGPLALMDAETLDFADEQFDVAVAAFVLFHLPNPDRCLSEIFRVLRRGGAVGTLTWGVEDYPAADAIWDEELAAAGSEPSPLPATDSRMRCNTTAKMTAFLEGAGFSDVASWVEKVEHQWRPENHFQYHLGSTSSTRLAALPAADRAECLQRVGVRLSHRSDDDYIFRGDVIFAKAIK